MACFNMLLENKKSIKELIHKNSSSDILLGQENFAGVSRRVLVPFGSGAFINITFQIGSPLILVLPLPDRCLPK
ncbi:hypothetical protein J2Z18_000762 [Paenibacillus lactis]|uniref:Uncharacterized protein n=1 Tax=Paenibacillus lactis TaxID=228574 RepID=A0ABS4F607_9BACL|nr:hypothetical protein [Paenibacillus lactis]